MEQLPPPPKRTRVSRMADEDVPQEEDEFLGLDGRIGDEEGDSLMLQLAADEEEARSAAEAASRRAAGVHEGRIAGMCSIEVCLPSVDEGAPDGVEDMFLIDPDEGF